MARRGRPPGTSGRISRKTPDASAARIIERDLATMTGPLLLKKYSSEGIYKEAFERLTGKQAADVAPTHNPFWHYALAVWFDNPEGRAMLSDPHRTIADAYLKLATGELDEYDGLHQQFPRRGLKSTWMMAFADWLPKYHRLVDGIDITVLYSHNHDNEAKRRLETIKNKNRYHPYVLNTFSEFAIPAGEWGTKEEWNWPCRGEATSVAESSMMAMSAAAKKAGKGFNYRLLDDWEDEDSRNSQVIRETLSDAYDQLRKLKAVPFAREASQGTPYSLHSLYKPMLESKRGDGRQRYHVVKIAAADENFERSNFPNIPSLTLNGLARERQNEIGRRGNDDFFWLQYMLRPNTSRLQAMQWEWFRKMSMPDYIRNWAKIPHFTVVLVDSAWKGDEAQAEGCYTAIGLLKIFQVGPHMERVLCELTMSNSMSSDEGALEMCRMMKKWATPYYSVEQVNDKPFVGLFRQIARAQSPPLFPVFIDLKGWSKKRKEDRISMVAGSARLGHFYYMDTIDPVMLGLFKDEVDTYPDALHRDGLDMVANSFAEAIVSAWVPVGIAPYERPEDNQYAPVAHVGRHIRLPVFSGAQVH